MANPEKDKRYGILMLTEDSNLISLCWWTICKKRPPVDWFRARKVPYKERVKLSQDLKELIEQVKISENDIYAVIDLTLKNKKEFQK